MRDSIQFCKNRILQLTRDLTIHHRECLSRLSFFDRIRFSRHMGSIHLKSVKKLACDTQTKLQHLVSKRFGHVEPVLGVILNLSTYELSELESSILSYGLDYCIPSRVADGEKIFSEFEVLSAQLCRLVPHSSDSLSNLKAILNDLAHTYAATPVALSESKWGQQQRSVVRTIKANNNLVITRPDKGAGIVLLDHLDYVSKMQTILSDNNFFLWVQTQDRTIPIEIKFQKTLLSWVKRGVSSLVRLVTIDKYFRPEPTKEPRRQIPAPIIPHTNHNGSSLHMSSEDGGSATGLQSSVSRGGGG